MTQSLEAFLSGLPKAAPGSVLLPISHISEARYLDSILSGKALVPRTCRFLQEDLVYCFYGPPAYRLNSFQSENVMDYPIAFLFKPSAMLQADLAIPFDSGAFLSGKYDSPKPTLKDLRRFQVSLSHPERQVKSLVALLYQGNKEYLEGRVREDLRMEEEPVPELADRLIRDLSPQGVDARQWAIEIIFRHPVALSKVEWLAVPNTKTFLLTLNQWFQQADLDIPFLYHYPVHRRENPAQLSYLLQREAENYLEKYLRIEELNQEAEQSHGV
ncbi:MAG: hypothetical protein DWQ01_22340 [Planctomycetota bacterium]|nr:MAG: hypothetical protein DWQ01_22340 [Planctomycetota bacterium]